MRYFYMIRKHGTMLYYSRPHGWTNIEAADVWWHSVGLKEAYKKFEELRDCWLCEIVKFRVEEMMHENS